MNYFCLFCVCLIPAVAFTAWLILAFRVCFSGDLTRLKTPVAIFDFDGTICPSFHLFIAELNALSNEYGHKKINPDEIENYRNLSAKNVVKTLGVSGFKLPFLIRKLRQNAKKQLLELHPSPQIAQVLQELQSKGISLGILTSNSEINVRLYLQKYGIHFFDFIYSGNNVFGKASHLRTILKKGQLNPKQDRILYIGDEARDMEAAKQAGITGVAVTWGYNSSDLLKQTHPDHLCDRPDQLLALINIQQ